MASLQAVLRLIWFLVLIAIFLGPVWLAKRLNNSLYQRLLCTFFRSSLSSWNVDVAVQGQPSTARPLLLISNHSSYIDVPVLGSLLPVRFTPKQEIAGWPVVGGLCRLANCIFIDRNPRKTAENRQNLQQQLAQGAAVSLYPEGTTNNGFEVLPFRSSYFSLAEMLGEGQLTVQPFSIRYTAKNGEELTPQQMDRVAWYGDMDFAPHLWDFLKSDGVLAHLRFHQPIAATQFTDRKALAQHCQQIITVDIQKKSAPEGALPNNGG